MAPTGARSPLLVTLQQGNAGHSSVNDHSIEKQIAYRGESHLSDCATCADSTVTLSEDATCVRWTASNGVATCEPAIVNDDGENALDPECAALTRPKTRTPTMMMKTKMIAESET
jgi:hypothetical protein